MSRRSKAPAAPGRPASEPPSGGTSRSAGRTTAFDALERAVRASGVLDPGARVAVAVSGGADSVALCLALRTLAPTLGIDVVGLIHVNHQLRGAAADADEQFCREFAESAGLPAHVERVEVDRGSGPTRKSPEEAARDARYAAFERGRVALGAELVALGHTRDDQAETVLLRLLRGSGPDGLAGIPPARGTIVRPLLAVPRRALHEVLESAGQPWVEDASNEALDVPRNSIRHSVLPVVEAAFPAARATLARHAEIAREEAAWLSGLANQAFDRHVHTKGDSFRVLSSLTAEPAAVARRVILTALRRAGVRQPGMDEVETVRALLAGALSAVELPGSIRANRIGDDVVLASRGSGHHAPPPGYRYTFRVPGSVEVPEASMSVAAFTRSEAPGEALRGVVDIEVDGEVLGASVIVRNWRRGDLIRPAGLGGRKKLQDVFVDGKLARELRARLPLVVDADDRVLWVPGLALDERLRVTSGTTAVVVLRLTNQQVLPVGGPE